MTALRRHMTMNLWNWNYCIIGDKGALHFWCHPLREMTDFDKKVGWCEDPATRPSGGGIEIHSLTKLYESQGEPSQEKCWLLGKPCWHDGSSLQAEEHWIPLWMRCNESGDFEPLWRSLEHAYRERFEETDA